MNVENPPVLPDGLVLRTAAPRDLEQIGALLTERGEAHDAVDHRLVVEDPDLGWSACAVVVDGERVVATATLLDETVRIGEVVLPAGQVELVAVDTEYEHRGLARALMDWAHRRSAERGHLLQLMIGIPYFYRRFGYEYAIDIASARDLSSDAAKQLRAQGGSTLRAATAADIPALATLQDMAQSGVDVAVQHPAARWRALLGQSSSRLKVLERDEVIVASARVQSDDGLLVAEAAVTDEAAAGDLLAALAREAGDESVTVVHREHTVTGRAWHTLLDSPGDAFEQYYIRIADPAPVLNALRPVLDRRATGLDLDRLGGALVISTFEAHYRLPVTAAGFGPVETGGPMQAPALHRGFGVAPDQLGALLFGGRGFAGLRRLRPDVYGNREVGEVLFPPQNADVLSYYLPW